MINVHNLHKKFKDNVVLDGIDFTVDEGEVVAIIGPSGSGKSTLLRCLNLLEQPDQGEIKIGEASLGAEHYGKKEVVALRQQTAMVFQHYNLFRNKTALQNVTAALILAKNMKKSEAERLGLEFLKQVNLEDQRDQYPVTLSGGQQQRVSIARALAVNPKAILLDEPTSALDPELVDSVLRVLRNLAEKKMTMIVVTHEIEFAREVADKVVFMADGKIIEQGAPNDVLRYSKNERTRRFLQQLDKHKEVPV
ncbi:amino acid ABC transporter ATP-binding protein [Sporolactobacillus sp. STSJ-5]|uniref:amino acid ABC transporter ATP-binding protein n=1 Tax=Sporolactobacillus sp. STSJ-5 TaxID=2965076 RepID=UPI0021028567|nr:amino acid ABC transporter ATP-binding protein [Sporolactobacillus sp. STSJ-5]MCQ2009576.1 amino acid ABC transporter ATP-binding protein [Sporolactobacillus sp. STSJ-5]